MLNFVLFLTGGKNVPSIYPTLKAPIFTRDDSMTSDESKKCL